MTQRTLSIIKPNAVFANQIGAINQRIEEAGLQIIALKMGRLRREQAEGLYKEQQGKPFFEGLVAFMTSGPGVVQVLDGEQAIERYRALMWSTDRTKALAGTLRADF